MKKQKKMERYDQQENGDEEKNMKEQRKWR